jgi:ABC-type Fe3+/spermidine/putrescine transport system ATPase subunit
MTQALRLRDVDVAYGSDVVVWDIDLDVSPGEILGLLGPSGCGKTTLLYAIAGFVPIRRGSIEIGGTRVAVGIRGSAPEDRSVAMVFQNYALWPHMTALETVAYPMRRRGIDKRGARDQARDLLDRMGIGQFGDRLPSQLSGGQQQRVGLARALAREARLFLLDEPTAHLDAGLRDELIEAILERQRASGTAAVYATHDAAEVLTVADRVALMRDGRIVQVGDATDVFDRPVDLWAAALTGPVAVLDSAEVLPASLRLFLAGQDTGLRLSGSTPEGPVRLLVRPNWVEFGGPLTGRVLRTRYRGTATDHDVEVAGGTVVIRTSGRPRFSPGVAVTWSLRQAWLLDHEGRALGISASER